MTTKTTNLLFLLMIILTIGVGAFLYPGLPDQIASHWNTRGEVDDYMGKFWGVFLLPMVLVGLYIFYWLIPKIDPLKANIEKFRPAYNAIWLTIATFLVYIFALMMAWNLGYRFDFALAMVPAMALFFYLIGELIGKAKRNWFVGIRTPWTLSNDIVWDKTHRLGAKLFKAAAVIALLGLFFRGQAAFLIVIVPIVAIAIYTIIYSYLEHRKLPKT